MLLPQVLLQVFWTMDTPDLIDFSILLQLFYFVTFACVNQEFVEVPKAEFLFFDLMFDFREARNSMFELIYHFSFDFLKVHFV